MATLIYDGQHTSTHKCKSYVLLTYFSLRCSSDSRHFTHMFTLPFTLNC